MIKSIIYNLSNFQPEEVGDITDILERYVKKLILNYATFKGWIEESDY